MQIEVVNENAYTRKVNVTIPAADVRSALDKAYVSIGKRARLPGFRAGKVPRRVLEAQYGPSIARDVAGDLIQDAWTKAIADHGIEPVSRPNVVDQGPVKANVDFAFVIGVEVKPAVTCDTYEGLDVYWPKWEVTDAEIDAAVERERQAQSRLTAVTGRAVQLGDTVQVELTVKDGDEVVVSEPGTLVRTLGETWLKGLGDFLTGLEIDAGKDGEVTFADDARNTDVAGKTLAVSAKVLGIQAYEAPALDDALAKEIGHADVATMRTAVAGQLSKGREEQARNQARANLLEALIAANPFDIPAGMVEQNLQMLVEEFKLQQSYQGVDPRNIRFTQAQMADLRQRAVFAAKGGLLLEAVATMAKIEVTDDHVEAKLQELADDRGQSIEAVRGWFQQDGALQDLKERLLEEFTLDFVLGKAKVTHEAPEVLQGGDQPTVAPTDVQGDDQPIEAKPAKKKATKAKAEAPAVEAAPAEEPAAEEPKAKAKGGSAYKTIDGVKYAKDLLDMAEGFGPKLTMAQVQQLVESAQDGKGITDVEKRTLAWIRDNHTLAKTTQAWLAKAVELD
ncbi:MAG: trigger factor [Alphaproteobacteria bacterium]|nr:trigger factor [Alphaproteobacteria bacterium]